MKKIILALVAASLMIPFVYFLVNQNPETGEEETELPLTAQYYLQESFGNPSQFAVIYLPQEEEGEIFLIRSEIWFYQNINKKITLLGGRIAKVENYEPIYPVSPTNLKPEDFHYDMTKENLIEIFGVEGTEAVDYLPGLYQEGELETYISNEAIFIFEYGNMTYFQTFGFGEEKPEDEMDLSLFKDLFLAQEAYAKISLKKAFRSVGRACRFVIQLPDKATRWMGPVIGPVVSAIITKNIIKHPKFGKIFGKAKRIDKIIQDVEEQKELVAELKNAYKQQALDLQKSADEISQSREELKQDLLKGNISLDDYKENVVAIDKLIEAFNKGAQRFNNEAEKINLKTVVKMLGKKLLNNVLGQAREIVINEIGKEIKKLINPDVLDFLVTQDKTGFDAVLDMLLAGDLEEILKKGNYEGIDTDDLRERVREEIKKMLKKNKEDLKNNWKQMIKDITEGIKSEMEEEAEQYQAESEGEGKEVGTICDWEPEPVSEKCPSGYDWEPQSGVGCIQIDCFDEAIKHAHWDYTGRCVCGTSGSMNEKPTDPNKECVLPRNCAYCPGCVYSCVTFEEECPPIPTN